MPINISKLADTALAGAVGFKHIKNQAESNLMNAEGNISNTINQEQTATMLNAQAEQELKEFDTKNPSLVEDTLRGLGDTKRAEQSWLAAEQQLEDSQKGLKEAEANLHPRDPMTGKFVKRDDYVKPFRETVASDDANAQKKFDEFDAIKKSTDELQTKLSARSQLQTNVNARKTQLEVAQANTQRAQERYDRVQKETNWILGGKK